MPGYKLGGVSCLAINWVVTSSTLVGRTSFFFCHFFLAGRSTSMHAQFLLLFWWHLKLDICSVHVRCVVVVFVFVRLQTNLSPMRQPAFLFMVDHDVKSMLRLSSVEVRSYTVPDLSTTITQSTPRRYSSKVYTLTTYCTLRCYLF